MNLLPNSRHLLFSAPFAAACLFATIANATEVEVMLTGAQQVPRNVAFGSGHGTITIGDDKSVSGSVITTSIRGTRAEICEGAPGQNGDLIIPLVKLGDDYYVVPAGTNTLLKRLCPCA